MRLILGIHPKKEDTKRISGLLKRSLKGDPHTFLLIFPFDYYSPLDILKIKRELTKEQQRNIIIIGFDKNSKTGQTYFDGYRDSFLKIITKLKQELKPNEKIVCSGIGRQATVCYSAINKSAQRQVSKLFKERVVSQKSLLKFIEGSKYTELLKEQNRIRRLKRKSQQPHKI